MFCARFALNFLRGPSFVFSPLYGHGFRGILSSDGAGAKVTPVLTLSLGGAAASLASACLSFKIPCISGSCGNFGLKRYKWVSILSLMYACTQYCM